MLVHPEHPFSVPLIMPCFALKGSVPKGQRSYEQLKFVINAHTAGDKKKEDKLSPEIVHRMMTMVGTQKGEHDFNKYTFMQANTHRFPTFADKDVLTSD